MAYSSINRMDPVKKNGERTSDNETAIDVNVTGGLSSSAKTLPKLI